MAPKAKSTNLDVPTSSTHLGMSTSVAKSSRHVHLSRLVGSGSQVDPSRLVGTGSHPPVLMYLLQCPSQSCRHQLWRSSQPSRHLAPAAKSTHLDLLAQAAKSTHLVDQLWQPSTLDLSALVAKSIRLNYSTPEAKLTHVDPSRRIGSSGQVNLSRHVGSGS